MDFLFWLVVILFGITVLTLFRKKPGAFFFFVGIIGALIFTGVLDPILFEIGPELMVVHTPERLNISVEPRPLEPTIIPVPQPASNYTPPYLNDSVLGTDSLSTGDLLRT